MKQNTITLIIPSPSPVQCTQTKTQYTMSTPTTHKHTHANTHTHTHTHIISPHTQNTQVVDIFHVETVVDDNIFPWFLSWVLVLKRDMSLWQLVFMYTTVLSLPLLPLALRKWIFWSPLTWGPYGLVQVHAGETTAVHEKTLAANYVYVLRGCWCVSGGCWGMVLCFWGVWWDGVKLMSR